MEIQNLSNILPASAYFRTYESYSSKAQHALINISVSAVSPSPIELVKEALVRGISQMKQFNEKIDKKYPNSVAYVG